MKFGVTLFFIFSLVNCYSQENTFYINIPTNLKEGSITYNLHADTKDSIFTIIFSGLPKRIQDAGFFLSCDKRFIKTDKSYFKNKSIITPETIMDSLTQVGRSFFRKNKFYILFIKGENYYTHSAIGEYIFMDYREE